MSEDNNKSILTLADGLEANVEASMAAFERAGDLTALTAHNCLTLIQFACLIPAHARGSVDPWVALDSYLRIAFLDVAKGLLQVKHPKTLLPWSQYLRMLEAGMYGEGGEDTPMPDGSWLVDLKEAQRWYEVHGISFDFSKVEEDILALKGASIQVPLPAQPPEWMSLAVQYADEIWRGRHSNTNPSVQDISESIFKRFKEEGIQGKRGVLTAATIERQALRGWKKPTR